MTWLSGLVSLCAESSVLRLGTWNVQNYLLQNRWEESRYRFEYPKPEADKAALREQLLEARPAILFLQEIGSEAMLGELREDLAIAGLDYPFSHFSALSDSRSGLAILSSIAPDEVLHLDPKSESGTCASLTRRGIQEVVFVFMEKRLRIFHVHLKSRYTSDNADPDSRIFRAAELAALKGILDQRLAISGKNETLLLLGDLNTPFESPLLDPIRENWEPVPLTDVQGQQWTYHYKKDAKFELLDGFWTTPASVKAFTPVGLFPSATDASVGSDHRLAVAGWRPLPQK
ncbi:endonuclease/exonuclease/phosphatase family protein [Puniceicoccales bacterium CK1056]|uniref:Endonuclease/exonuclease/phosphatase family protein n=1 Tax=Oceanipulchritudo coccoides TaxID=2706888 RepID=A0A6B2LZZ4_9BACT|nr:endonuclease/exonuclease/phosphatase family protein [Oceanipulchritudo coccoides]NDV62281.1 endonuclease/exonuclease/phosphatase family protein [Oceanipulchritudo coccoides]